ncbi:MAG: 50S ribosomal protein L2 [Puniceicoccales bacterium]|jgi:large subunit ribosomal protein L2|nr:50S ribosomal protein L2 [Puniceicoccales bacterium]
MILIKSTPLTPGQRFLVKNKSWTSKKEPEPSLTVGFQYNRGRNCYGRITCRHRGGGHKRLYRLVDFKRDKYNVAATVESIEYDPNRSAHLALLKYVDGEKRYILAPEGLAIGDSVVSLDKPVSNYRIGMNFPLSCIPLAMKVHAVELVPGKGAQLARGAGVGLELVSLEDGCASLKMPSGEIRLVDARCRATIGRVGNVDHQNVILGKAGRKRWKGRRPSVRGVAMNPVDHPMGGGQTGGGNHPVSPWGQLAKGYITRKRKNVTNKYILIRRSGKKLKRG